MPLEIRYRTQGARTDLPSPLRSIAICVRRAGAGGVRLGSTVRLLAHFHCPRFLEHQKGGFPLRGTAEKLRLRGQGPGHRSRPTVRSGRRRARSVGAVWLREPTFGTGDCKGYINACDQGPPGPTARVGEEFGIFGTAFKITFPGSRNWSCNGAKSASGGRIAASGSAHDAESPADLSKSGRRAQLDRAEARARSQIDDDELSSAFRQDQFQDEAVRPDGDRLDPSVARDIDRGGGEGARNIAAA